MDQSLGLDLNEDELEEFQLRKYSKRHNGFVRIDSAEITQNNEIFEHIIEPND